MAVSTGVNRNFELAHSAGVACRRSFVHPRFFQMASKEIRTPFVAPHISERQNESIKRVEFLVARIYLGEK